MYVYMNMTRIHLRINVWNVHLLWDWDVEVPIFDEKYINYEEGGCNQEHPQQNYTLASKNH